MSDHIDPNLVPTLAHIAKSLDSGNPNMSFARKLTSELEQLNKTLSSISKYLSEIKDATKVIKYKG